MDSSQQRLYPDLAALGGLEAAMKDAARLRGCDIGQLYAGPDVVRIETTRGVVAVDLVRGERRFRMSVHIPESTWPVGSTNDLGLLVEAVAAWREGMPFDELRVAFGFLELDEFTGMLEAGEPTNSQWYDLLSSDFYRGQWELLHRIRSDETLRKLFPTVTHGAVRLRANPLDGASRQVLVGELDDGNYEVLRVGMPGMTWVEVEAANLIEYLRAAFDLMV